MIHANDEFVLKHRQQFSQLCRSKLVHQMILKPERSSLKAEFFGLQGIVSYILRPLKDGDSRPYINLLSADPTNGLLPRRRIPQYSDILLPIMTSSRCRASQRLVPMVLVIHKANPLQALFLRAAANAEGASIMRATPICTCGRGQVNSSFTNVNDWKKFAPHVTAIAITPIFPAPWLDSTRRNEFPGREARGDRTWGPRGAEEMQVLRKGWGGEKVCEVYECGVLFSCVSSRGLAGA
jgi:hypothetical protein